MPTPTTLPACGLHRTVFPLPGKAEAVPAGTLVYFHNHSDEGPPVVLLPNVARDNRWTFRKDGYLVDDTSWCHTIVSLPKEGFYQLQADLWIGGGQKLPEGLLIQLGYTRQGQPAAFPGLLADGSTIRFQRKGALLTDLQVDRLRRSDFRLLAPAPAADADAKADGPPAAGTAADTTEANGAAPASESGSWVDAPDSANGLGD